jgi:hypothetical protein
MSQPYVWPVPAWLSEIADAEEAQRKYVKFMLQLAAVYASEDGQSQTLSRMIGYSDTAVNKARQSGHISVEMALSIEKQMGENFTAKLFRPDKFSQ